MGQAFRIGAGVDYAWAPLRDLAHSLCADWSAVATDGGTFRLELLRVIEPIRTLGGAPGLAEARIHEALGKPGILDTNPRAATMPRSIWFKGLRYRAGEDGTGEPEILGNVVTIKLQPLEPGAVSIDCEADPDFESFRAVFLDGAAELWPEELRDAAPASAQETRGGEGGETERPRRSRWHNTPDRERLLWVNKRRRAESYAAMKRAAEENGERCPDRETMHRWEEDFPVGTFPLSPLQ